MRLISDLTRTHMFVAGYLDRCRKLCKVRRESLQIVGKLPLVNMVSPNMLCCNGLGRFFGWRAPSRRSFVAG